MSDRCEPPEEWRDMDGLACWVSLDGAAMVWTWDAAEDGGSWWAQDVTMSVEDATAKGWRYAERVPFPSDLAAAKEREAALVDGLKIIANFPFPEQDDFHGTNMRAVAARTLDTLAPGWRTTP